MSGKRNRQRGKNKKKGAQGAPSVSLTHAPTMQHMHQTDTWIAYDLVPVFIQDQSTANIAEPVLLQIECGTNGWNYVITQGNSVVSNEAALYGQLTSQYAQLSLLWQTYRLNGVMLEFTPSGFQGSGQSSPMTSVVDGAGRIVPILSSAPAFEILSRFSRSRTLEVTPATRSCMRRLDYRNWLVQTTATPWLLTQNGQSIDGRQLYPEAAEDQRTPVIRMAGQYLAPVGNQLIGFIRVAASYTFRGQRLGTTTADEIRMLMREANLSAVDLIQAGPPRDTAGPQDVKGDKPLFMIR